MAPSVVVDTLVLARRRRRRHAFLSRLGAGAAGVEDGELRHRLETEGRYAGYFEWRIGTVTEERIERTTNGWTVSSRCDLALSVTVDGVPKALAARAAFASLHSTLFYGLGWPSWAAHMQMEPPATPWDRFDDEVDPYLRDLSDDATSRFATDTEAIRAAVERGGWRDEHAAASARIEWEPEGERPYRAAVERGGLKITWRSPTIERTLQFVGILEPLAADLVTHFDWR